MKSNVNVKKRSGDASESIAAMRLRLIACGASAREFLARKLRFFKIFAAAVSHPSPLSQNIVTQAV